ncbi:hypothetical protein ACLMJK_000614 [Lecanora helva]
MGAEAFGGNILSEVKEEGLHELLHSLRELVRPSRDPLAFPPLDNLLNVFQNPPQTRQHQQYQGHQAERPAEEHRTTSSKEKLPPVIEIMGATACSGKTQLLYNLVSSSLLPNKYQNVSLGKSNAVIFLDLSGKFSILRLHEILSSHARSVFQSKSVPFTEQQLSTLISDSLMHLHLFHPHSFSSLLAILDSLPSYLFAQPSTHFSSNRQLGLLAINDVSSFLWQDRLDADEEAGIGTTSTADKASNSLLLKRYRTLVSILRDFQHRFSCTIVATNCGVAPVTLLAGHRALRPNLPSVWNNFCTVKIVVERDRVSKFGPGMSAEEAILEGPQRWEAVKKSCFSVWVNWWDSQGWREEVREALKSMKHGGSFTSYVTARGFTLDEANGG